MEKGKNRRFLILVLALCLFSLFTTAQTNPSYTTLNKINNKIQDYRSTLPDSVCNENLSNVLSAELDSLVSTWYVKKAFNLDSLNLVDRSDTLNIEYSDSVYINRLKNIDSFINLPFNETVKKLITFYTEKRRSLVSIMLGLSNYYFPLFEETLAKYDLPIELKYVPIIESALNPKAISRARAAGLWQFMYPTAKLYGLEINSYIDERFDPLKSTVAACRFLKDLYDVYQDWHLVLAAYNCGPGNIDKAIQRSGGDQNYWDIYYKLPRETRGYIPIFVAAAYVMNYAKEHRLTPVKPSFKMETDTIELHSYYNFEQISAIINIPIEELRLFNPQYKRNVIPAKSDKPYILRLPSDKVLAFIDNQDKIYAYNRDKFFPNNQIVIPKGSLAWADIDGKKKVYYTVRSGDNPGSIAKKHHISLANLRNWNNLRHDVIRAGQKLVIYVPSKGEPRTKQLFASTSDKSVERVASPADTLNMKKNRGNTANTGTVGSTPVSEEYTYYTVKSGDNLYAIAKKFNGVSDAEIMNLNQITDVNSLMPGQKLKIPIKDNGI